jgi:hypothetical protein
MSSGIATAQGLRTPRHGDRERTVGATGQLPLDRRSRRRGAKWLVRDKLDQCKRRPTMTAPRFTTARRSAGLATAVVLLVAIATLVILEIVARLLVEPSERSYGRLAGLELPPVPILREGTYTPDTARLTPVETIDGETVTQGDLWGIWQFDPVLGYRQMTDARSANGWWQANTIGARSRLPTTAEVAPGRTRVLVFGDSYAHARGVRQEDAWTSALEQMAPDIEAVNLAADGYGTAQAWLRYRQVAAAVEHQAAVLVLVPGADLWRDVNVIRDLGQFWNLPRPMPRAILGDGGLGEAELEIVPPPYADPHAYYARNYPVPSRELIAHLERHDRFYLPLRHDTPPLIGDLVLYKIVAAVVSSRQRARLMREAVQPGSEAVRVTRAIVAAMHDDVTAGGRQFLAVVAPMETEIGRLRDDADFAAAWRATAAALCGSVAGCVDRSHRFTALDPACLDVSADGTHYGPRLNDVLARMVLRELGHDVPSAATATPPCGASGEF